MRSFSVLVAVLILPVMAFSLNWESGEKGTVSRVLDGDSLMLENGLIVRLAQIEAPQIKFDSDEGNRAKQFLENLVIGKRVTLKYGGLKRDKMGRALAQVTYTDSNNDETWVNLEILLGGFARVHTYIDNRKEVGAFWAAEREARKSLKGIWANPKYQVRHGDAPDLIGAQGTFQLVEGKVVKAETIGSIARLCFGKDPEKDFCALIPKASWELFDGGINTIAGFEGWNLRIRGRVAAAKPAHTSSSGKQYLAHGPQIWLDHPEQIEFILAK